MNKQELLNFYNMELDELLKISSKYIKNEIIIYYTYHICDSYCDI